MKKAKLNFGERMREWRKARKEYADKVKSKLKEKQEISDNYPELKPDTEAKVINLSPTQQTEMKPDLRSVAPTVNHIDKAIEYLRNKIKDS